MRGFVFGDGFGYLDLLAGLVLVAVGFAGGPRSLRWLACRFPLAKWRSGFQRSVVLGQASFAFSMESPQPRIVPMVLLDARCFCFRCCYPFAWRGCVLWIVGRPRWLVVRLVLSSLPAKLRRFSLWRIRCGSNVFFVLRPMAIAPCFSSEAAVVIALAGLMWLGVTLRIG
ncbi:unnamed protein product [Arabidopsis arenosa]|uniref:Uncharacterized protein n=1 Tax=Arabidopsis arenosa TaxID=38785 RepID=A0A8S2AR70_ARAAE|nr:unnamed protein product [Arabidopsis arenosa]CAE6186447.1 unnamed protein product [Arabidopsis arenosa]